MKKARNNFSGFLCDNKTLLRSFYIFLKILFCLLYVFHDHLCKLLRGVKSSLGTQKLIKSGFYVFAVKVAAKADYVRLAYDLGTLAKCWVCSDV